MVRYMLSFAIMFICTGCAKKPDDKIDASGWRDWTNDPFTSNCRGLFSYHETACPNIYDACLQVDSDGNPIMQPCTGEQPKNMAFGGYRDKFVDPGDKTWVSGAVRDPASVK